MPSVPDFNAHFNNDSLVSDQTSSDFARAF